MTFNRAYRRSRWWVAIGGLATALVAVGCAASDGLPVYAHAVNVQARCYERPSELVGFVPVTPRVDQTAVARDPVSGELWLFESRTEAELLEFELCELGGCGDRLGMTDRGLEPCSTTP